MALDLECPQCGKTMTLKVGAGVVLCNHCGYTPMHDGGAVQDPTPKRQSPKRPADARITSRHKPTPRQETLFYEGMLALDRGNRKTARDYFRKAVEIDRAFTDPWLWLVSTFDDPAKQRKCLEWVLTYEPDHPQAFEALALLDGRLAPEAAGPDAALNAQQMDCPQCGGKLTYDVVQRQVICWHCNYREMIQVRSTGKQTMLSDALLKRKHQAVRWEATERVLACNNCGASVTLSAHTMTDRCTFCDSQRVLVMDNSEHFEQPDGIIPFMVTEAEAVEAVQQAESSGLRAVTRFFRDAISHGEAHPIYIPFWAFDGTAEVSWSYPGSPFKGKEITMLRDILASATRTLDRGRLKKIEPFELDAVLRYDPRYLADWPAELYQLDVDEASLLARQEISKTAVMRVRVRQPAKKRVRQSASFSMNTAEEEVKLYISPAHITGITYRLVLLPVWVVLLHEEDGDVRRNLVNGQTGKVTLEGRLGGLL